jgi:hypothetical protein
MQQGAKRYGSWIVNAQDINCRFAYFCNPDQACLVPTEVIMPRILAGMKQADYGLLRGTPACNVRPFVPVAGIAAPGEIVLLRRAMMLLGDDVVDLERR